MIPMKASFWKALEALGASGSALFDWKHHLGDDWDACAPLLKPTGRIAFRVIDPRQPKRRLTVDVDGEEDFVGYDENDPGLPPAPFRAPDVAEYRRRWPSMEYRRGTLRTRPEAGSHSHFQRWRTPDALCSRI